MRWAPLIITSLFVSLLVMARVAEFVPESWWPSNETLAIGDHETTKHSNLIINETYRIQALTWFGTGKQCAVKGVQIVRLKKASETADEQPIVFRIATCVIEPGAGSLPSSQSDKPN